MKTPIYDFVRGYSERNTLRLHMPGHKGKGPLGLEALDLTEIDGADSLYEASGIIRESEENASALFGCPTFYSTEGSSLCIRAMLYLACLHAREMGVPYHADQNAGGAHAKNAPRCADQNAGVLPLQDKGGRPLVWAGRNAHKTFLSAAALLGFDVEWLYPAAEESYLSCRIDPVSLEKAFAEAAEKPCAVYLTDPDYLGSLCDITKIAKVCHEHGALLLVDNAHGAYLRFLPQGRHPMDCGADICCDSAHKTLPVLTGGAYLHVSAAYPHLVSAAKDALALFGSTSPSYLILQSLDAANDYLEGHRARLEGFLPEVERCKKRLRTHGYKLIEQEKLKITIFARDYGYTGQELSEILLNQDIVCEFADPDYIVFMITTETGRAGLERLCAALEAIPARPVLHLDQPHFKRPEKVLSPREAALSPAETLPAEECLGRVLALATVGCPPAVPIVVSGERIDENALKCFEYYGIKTCRVIREDR